MKKLILSLALVGAMAGYAQDAQVNFNNSNLSSPPDRLVRDASGAGLVGTNWVAVLLYGTSDTSLTAHTGVGRFRPSTTTLPGTWGSGGTRTLTGIPGTAGTTLRLQVAVFDNSIFASYTAANAAGQAFRSLPFDFVNPTPPFGPTSFDMVNFQGFTIPEPSVIGLGLIGAAALFLLRRRKAA